MNEMIKEIAIGEWTLKIREPEDIVDKNVVLLLHGWTGDENSMLVFGSQLPQGALVISPRAPYPIKGSNLGGYSWVDRSIDFWPTYKDFMPAVYSLKELLDKVEENYSFNDFDKISLVGFSQGGAMAIAFALNFPSNITKLAVLAGFIPDQIAIDQPVGANYDVYIGHGEKDTIVPIEKARETKRYFESNGNKIVFCTSPVEHRLGRECAVGMRAFLEN